VKELSEAGVHGTRGGGREGGEMRERPGKDGLPRACWNSASWPRSQLRAECPLSELVHCYSVQSRREHISLLSRPQLVFTFMAIVLFYARRFGAAEAKGNRRTEGTWHKPGQARHESPCGQHRSGQVVQGTLSNLVQRYRYNTVCQLLYVVCST